MFPSGGEAMMVAMPPEEPRARAQVRDAGLNLVQSWTVAVAVGAIGLTGVLGLAAADTFRGHNTGPAQQSSSPTDNGVQDNGGITPQAPPDSSFGGGGQPPAVVSGGS
jgi:hypothetical protein